MASSGALPPSSTLWAAAHAASKPLGPEARSIDLSARLLPAASRESMARTSPSGMSRLIADSPNALGRAISAGTRDSGLRTAGPPPNARGSRATLRPWSASISTVAARTPTRSSRECQAGPAR